MWYDVRNFVVEGQAFSDLEAPFDRLPKRANGVVDEVVWNLSRNSAGICVRFESDSPRVAADWQLVKPDLSMGHMAATGCSGADLYVRDQGKWRFAGMSKNWRDGRGWNDPVTLPAKMREYLLYFPLYNAVTSVRIAVDPGTTIRRPPPRTGGTKPIAIYGTSIVHGGCCSRPGMCYPAQIGRRLDRPMVNLGFSGNGKMQPSIVPFLTEVNADVFVIDCLPNMNPQLVDERTEPLVNALRKAHPTMPILLIENITYQGQLSDMTLGHKAKNEALRKVYDRLIKAGVNDLHYLKGDNLLGDDWDATVDGTHPNDLGFYRMAEAITPAIRAVLPSK
jgi:hypothetical protein